MPAARETTFAALVHVRDNLLTFLSASASDFAALGCDAEEIRQEVTQLLRDRFSDELGFVEERYEQDPLGKPLPTDGYGVGVRRAA